MAELRKFGSVEEMDQTLIDNWNGVVKKSDRVFVLGDVSWHSAEQTDELLSELKGQKFLILGNHDEGCEKRYAKHFGWIDQVRMIKLNVNGVFQKVWLSHYAHRTWPSSHYGTWHLYGHSHGNLLDDPFAKSLDAGVDCWNLTPARADQIAERMDRKLSRPVDHHFGPAVPVYQTVSIDVSPLVPVGPKPPWKP